MMEYNNQSTTKEYQVGRNYHIISKEDFKKSKWRWMQIRWCSLKDWIKKI
jgi:hypothetical protein